MPHLTSRNATGKLRDYAITNMDKNSIVVADSRIYRGRIALLFNDFHYLESAYLPQVIEANKNLSGTDMPIKIYFVECGVDDCGWGTIKNQPEFNQSMEQIASLFSSNLDPQKILYGGGGEGVEEKTYNEVYKVYETTINLKPQVVSLIDSTHDWFYYPVNYEPKEKIFDNYNVNGAVDGLIYKFAWLVIISSIILAILMPFLVIYYLIKEN